MRLRWTSLVKHFRSDTDSDFSSFSIRSMMTEIASCLMRNDFHSKGILEYDDGDDSMNETPSIP